MPKILRGVANSGCSTSRRRLINAVSPTKLKSDSPELKVVRTISTWSGQRNLMQITRIKIRRYMVLWKGFKNVDEAFQFCIQMSGKSEDNFVRYDERTTSKAYILLLVNYI